MRFTEHIIFLKLLIILMHFYSDIVNVHVPFKHIKMLNISCHITIKYKRQFVTDLIELKHF